MSAQEYRLLHQYLLSRAPATRKRVPSPPRYDAVSAASDDYNAAAIRTALRLAVVTFSGLKAWEVFAEKVLSRDPAQRWVHSTGTWLYNMFLTSVI